MSSFKYDLTKLSDSDLNQLQYNLDHPGDICLSNLARLRDATDEVDAEVMRRYKEKYL